MIGKNSSNSHKLSNSTEDTWNNSINLKRITINLTQQNKITNKQHTKHTKAYVTMLKMNSNTTAASGRSVLALEKIMRFLLPINPSATMMMMMIPVLWHISREILIKRNNIRQAQSHKLSCYSNAPLNYADIASDTSLLTAEMGRKSKATVMCWWSSGYKLSSQPVLNLNPVWTWKRHITTHHQHASNATSSTAGGHENPAKLVVIVYNLVFPRFVTLFSCCRWKAKAQSERVVQKKTRRKTPLLTTTKSIPNITDSTKTHHHRWRTQACARSRCTPTWHRDNCIPAAGCRELCQAPEGVRFALP